MKLQTPEELRGFHEFVGEKLNIGAADLTPEEVLDQWRVLHPDSDELTQSVAAVRQAVDDMAAGDSGRPLDEVLTELRTRHGLARL